MKKIYSKFTKDRRAQFQIETYIAEENGERYVAKRALTEEARAHVHRMLAFYNRHEQREMLCPAAQEREDTVRFSFLQGKSLCKEMLTALSRRDRDAFMGFLTHYHEILMHSISKEQTCEQEDGEGTSFTEVFGDADIAGMETACNLDIDLTFDNIIHVGDFDPVSGDITQKAADHYQIIDYEWVFPFPVPINYTIYRAIASFYLKYASVMRDIITLQDMYNLFMITPEQVQIFEGMNANFDDYVYGTYGAHQILKGYCKENYQVKKLLPEENLFAQVFWNTGKGYSEEESIRVPVERPRAKVRVVLENSASIHHLRVDPLNVSSRINHFKLTAVLKDGKKVDVTCYTHNGLIMKNGDYLFAHEDPQFHLKNKWGEKLYALEITFDIVAAGLAEDPVIGYLTEQKGIKEKVKEWKAGRKA